MLGPRRSLPTLADLLQKKARRIATRQREQKTIQEAFAARLSALRRETHPNETASATRRRKRIAPA